MKRKIEFRGKRIDNGEWVYGYYRYMWGSNQYVIYAKKNNVDYIYKVDPATVGQYIGINGNNGEEIYEGDKFNVEDGIVGIMAYDESNICFSLAIHEMENDGSLEFIEYDNCYLWKQMSAIGNIHESVDSQGGNGA